MFHLICCIDFFTKVVWAESAKLGCANVYFNVRQFPFDVSYATQLWIGSQIVLSRRRPKSFLSPTLLSATMPSAATFLVDPCILRFSFYSHLFLTKSLSISSPLKYSPQGTACSSCPTSTTCVDSLCQAASPETEPEAEPEAEGRRIGRQACTCTTADGTTLTGSSGPATTQSLESLVTTMFVEPTTTSEGEPEEEPEPEQESEPEEPEQEPEDEPEGEPEPEAEPAEPEAEPAEPEAEQEGVFKGTLA